MSIETPVYLAPLAGTDACAIAMEQDESTRAFRQLVITFLKLQRRIEDMLAPHGLVLSQFEALAKIGCKPGMIQQELVKLLLVTKGNVGALLDRLESTGLVERRVDPNDRRANRLYLTVAGKDLMTELFRKHQAFIQETFKPMSLVDRATLESLLKILEPH